MRSSFQSICVCLRHIVPSLQAVSSYLNVSLQSIGDRTISLFSRSFNFLQPSSSSSPDNLRHDLPLKKEKFDSDDYTVSSHSGVYRNQSRRKYQTSSLRNPYRRSSTNFPVRGHEAVFLPEFSIKGKITEADFEVGNLACEIVESEGHAADLGHGYHRTRSLRKCDTGPFNPRQAGLRYEDHE